MIRIVEHINLSSALSKVLLDSDGPLGRYLMLAIAVERGHSENIARLSMQLDIPLATIETASAEAASWAESALSLTS